MTVGCEDILGFASVSMEMDIQIEEVVDKRGMALDVRKEGR